MLIYNDEVNPIALRLQNTGNVHSQTTVTTSLSGPLTNTKSVSSLHIILPGTSRLLRYSISAPRLPGIYTLTISANTGYNSPATTTLQLFYIPLWFIIIIGIALFIVPSFIRTRRNKNLGKTQVDKLDKDNQNVSGTAV